MKTTDQILKIKAVVSYILQNVREGMDYIPLFKVMYFSQQKHLTLYGMPLMDDSFVARKHGPVPTLTYKVMRGLEGKIDLESEELKDFASALSVATQDGHQVVRLKASASCDMDELSVSNVRMLDEVMEQYKDVAAFDLSDLSHDKAWKNAQKRAEKTGENAKMALYEIAEAGGATKEMLSVIRERQLISHALA